MKNFMFLIFILMALVLFSACAGPSALVGEVGPYEQWWGPTIKGGCIVGTENVSNLWVKYENGSCTVKTSPMDQDPLEGWRKMENGHIITPLTKD